MGVAEWTSVWLCDGDGCGDEEAQSGPSPSLSFPSVASFSLPSPIRDGEWHCRHSRQSNVGPECTHREGRLPSPSVPQSVAESAWSDLHQLEGVVRCVEVEGLIGEEGGGVRAGRGRHLRLTQTEGEGEEDDREEEEEGGPHGGGGGEGAREERQRGGRKQGGGEVGGGATDRAGGDRG